MPLVVRAMATNILLLLLPTAAAQSNFESKGIQLARSLTHSLHRFLKSPASVTDPVAADVWQISSGASNAMQGVYFVIGYEKEPSPLSHLRRVSPMAPRPLNFCAFHMRSACSTFQSGRGDRWRRRAQFVSAACFEKSS